MDERLAPGLEVSAFIRSAEQAGGVGTVLQKGDPQRGSILVQVTCRGSHKGFLDRSLQSGGGYKWQLCGPQTDEPERVAQYLGQRQRSDPDCWIIELDIPAAERFIAETTAEG